jgi:SAM-dependent methyltransferase
VDYEYWIPFTADVIVCRGCGLVSQNPVPSDTDVIHYYPDDYANYSTPGSVITSALVQLTEYLSAREVQKLIGNSGAILDVGCADGHYLESMRKHGRWELHGLDITDEAVRKTKDKGFVAYEGTMETADLPLNYFSLVRMNHILEHVTDPVLLVRKSYEVLRPGGYLVIETPNTLCPDLAVLGRYWGALHMPRHIFIFNTVNIISLLKKAGFQEITITYPLMTTGWSLGVQNFLQSRKKKKLRNGRLSWYPLMLLMFVPVLIIQKLLRKTTMMGVVARKRATEES